MNDIWCWQKKARQEKKKNEGEEVERKLRMGTSSSTKERNINNLAVIILIVSHNVDTDKTIGWRYLDCKGGLYGYDIERAIL